MRPPKISHTTGLLVIGLFVGTLASCASAADAATETVVYSFQNNGKDGLLPEANLIDVNGTLYGTTDAGGTGRCDNGCGTIFSVNVATGAETVQDSFSGVQRMAPHPGALVAAKGKLFGTTQEGGHRDAGMIYSFNPKSDAFKQRYYYCNLYDCSDGEAPNPDLLYSKSTLYGTTYNGGKIGSGTVFSFDVKTGTETVLYSFCGQQNCTDGALPVGGLLGVKGILYGTTIIYGSGTYCPSNNYICGTVFSLDPATGVETVIYSFCNQQACTDGAEPRGNLLYSKQVLYGTTYFGGTYNQGTVFSIDLSTGTETVLYSFGGRHDGTYPVGGLIHVNDKLYGITVSGGRAGDGTVYSINPKTGAERVIYSFCSQTGCADGAIPQAGLLDVNGTLYGVTYEGGSGTCNSQYGGCGTVFSITP
jgi:uncharacterized repeat protein (TIGR03803 family)